LKQTFLGTTQFGENKKILEGQPTSSRKIKLAPLRETCWVELERRVLL